MTSVLPPKYYEIFVAKCAERKIQVDIKEDKYLRMRDEFPEIWSAVVKACIEWLDDTGKRKINAMRLRTFANNMKKRNKDEECKRLERNLRDRERYAENKEITGRLKQKEELTKQAERNKREQAESQSMVDSLKKEEDEFRKCKEWCIAHPEKARAYMQQAQDILFNESPFIKNLSRELQLRLIKPKARILIRQYELTRKAERKLDFWWER